jgi:hypothetical protein
MVTHDIIDAYVQVKVATAAVSADSHATGEITAEVRVYRSAFQNSSHLMEQKCHKKGTKMIQNCDENVTVSW